MNCGPLGKEMELCRGGHGVRKLSMGSHGVGHGVMKLSMESHGVRNGSEFFGGVENLLLSRYWFHNDLCYHLKAAGANEVMELDMGVNDGALVVIVGHRE